MNYQILINQIKFQCFLRNKQKSILNKKIIQQSAWLFNHKINKLENFLQNMHKIEIKHFVINRYIKRIDYKNSIQNKILNLICWKSIF